MSEKQEFKLKITCKAPKGKVEKAAKNFKRMFSVVHKPYKYKVVNKTTFYFLYSFKTEKQRYVAINKKIPKVTDRIRGFYIVVISLVERGNKLAKKGAWSVEKARRWILNRLGKKGYNKKEMEDFIDGINLEDKEEMQQFLNQEIVKGEVLE